MQRTVVRSVLSPLRWEVCTSRRLFSVRCFDARNAKVGSMWGLRSYADRGGYSQYPQYTPQQPQASPYQGYYGQPAYQQMPPPPPPTGMPMGMGGHQEPEGPLGTRERPLVVAAAPTRMRLSTKLLIFLLAGLLTTILLGYLDEDTARGVGQSDLRSSVTQRGPLATIFNNSEVKPVDIDAQHVTFNDVLGCDEAKEELEEIVQFLKNPKKFVELGGRLPKGALLTGPPGCGKTMLAKAIAKEAGVKFFYATGSEFDEMFVGVGSRRVRELFAAAKTNGPALIFIDEIDALGGKRQSRDHSYSRMTLNQLLAEMDGFQSSDEVIVIGATNAPESLDKALTRPGRFDTQVAVDPPDMKGRSQILELYISKIKKDASVKAHDIAKGTAGFTGADLRNLVNVAAIRAAILDQKFVTEADMQYAKDRVMMGAECKSKIVPDADKRITAYHEGGHALVALLLEKEGADPVAKATIIPRGNGIMGLVQQVPDEDKYSMSKRQMDARLRICVAGRVAEQMLLGDEDITSGASSDFQQATKLARTMVRRYGFSNSIGFVDYESADTNEGAMISDATKAKIEDEVRKTIGEAYADATKLLTDNRQKLDSIAKSLLKYETLSGEQLKDVIAGKELNFPEPPKKKKAAASQPTSIKVVTSSGKVNTSDAAE